MKNGGRGCRSPAAARAATSAVGSKVNGWPGTRSPGLTLRMSNGCNGCSISTRSRTGADAVWSSVSSSSASGTDGGCGVTGVLVGAGVGDHQRFGGRADRIEQQLPVLGTDVALAGHRLAGQDVVAVGQSMPAGTRRRRGRPGTPPGAAPTASAPSCRRSGCRCGSWRGSGARPGCHAQQRADVGQPQRRRCRENPPRPVPSRTRGAAVRVARRRRSVTARQQRDTVASASSHSASGRVPSSESVTHGRSRSNVFGEPAGEFDPVAADVVERQRGAQPCLRVIGHGDPGQDPVQPETPGVLHELVESVGLAVVCVESPADARLADPGGRCVEIVVGETEAGAHRGCLGEVEHLRWRWPARRPMSSNCAATPEQRIGLGQRAVGEPDPEPVGRDGRPVTPRPGRNPRRSAARRSRYRGTSPGCRGARATRRRPAGRATPHAARRPAGRGCGSVHLHRAVVAGEHPAARPGRRRPAMSACSQPSRVSGPGVGAEIYVVATVRREGALSSRRSRPRVASSGCPAWRWPGAPRRGIAPCDPSGCATTCHSGAAATGAGRDGWPGRPAVGSR